MKKTCFLLMLAGLLAGCNYNHTETYSYKINEPVVMSMGDFRNSVRVTKEQHQISNYGKICFYNGFLYISESEVGIHIIDNTNPSQPRIVGFIELVGNADLAIRDNLLYADALIDLVWFDITDPVNPKLKGRLENAFPDALPAIDNQYGYDYYMFKFRSDSEKFKEKGWMIGISGGYETGKFTQTTNGYTFSKFETVEEDFERQAKEIMELIETHWKQRAQQ